MTNFVLENNYFTNEDLEHAWARYCEYNKITLDIDEFAKYSKVSKLEIKNWRSLKKRVLNSFEEWFKVYQYKSFDINSIDIIQNTLTGRFLKHLSITRKSANRLLETLIKSNPNKKIILVLYPEMHSCWKRCHWYEIDGKSTMGQGWDNHNKLLCECFPNPKRKHYKCKRRWHMHGWQVEDLNSSTIKKETRLTSFFETVKDKVWKLCYNMKDWKFFYKYSREYIDGGLILKKKWFITLDSEKYLINKQKTSERNFNYYQKNKELDVSEINSDPLIKEKKLVRKALLGKKYYTEELLKKLSWDKKNERKILKDKLDEIKQKLDISKPISKVPKVKKSSKKRK